MTAARSISLSKKIPRKQDKVVWIPKTGPFFQRCLQIEVWDAQFSFSRNTWVDVLLCFVRAVLSTLPWLITQSQVFGTRSSDLVWIALMAWWKISSKTPPWSLQSRNSQTTVPEKHWSKNCGLRALKGSLSSRWQVTRTRDRWTTTMKEVRESSSGYPTSSAPPHSRQSSALREFHLHPTQALAVSRPTVSPWIISTTAKSRSTLFKGKAAHQCRWAIIRLIDSYAIQSSSFLWLNNFESFLCERWPYVCLFFFRLAMSKLIGSNKSVILETNEM